MKRHNLIRTALLGLVACIAFGTSRAAAETIRVEFTGVNLSYDGATLTDANSSGPDDLTTATVTVDGVQTPSSPLLSGLRFDLSVPGITDIDITGDSVTNMGGGTFQLNLGGGDFLGLNLTETTVNYQSLFGLAQFVFTGSVGNISGQALPDGLILGDPVQVSFSTQVQSATDDGSNFLTFTSAGTGEVEGELIPEPTALLLAAIATAAVGRRR